jgi:hypothetical protein
VQFSISGLRCRAGNRLFYARPPCSLALYCPFYRLYVRFQNSSPHEGVFLGLLSYIPRLPLCNPMWSGVSLIRVTISPLSFSLQHLTKRSLAYGFQLCLKAMKPVNWDRFSKVLFNSVMTEECGEPRRTNKDLERHLRRPKAKNVPVLWQQGILWLGMAGFKLTFPV